MRVRVFKMDNVELSYSSMNCIQAEKFIESGRDLVNRLKSEENKPTVKEWEDRTITIVLDSLNRAGANPPWTAEKIKTDLDPKLLGELFKEILTMTGLVTDAPAGEQKAATLSSASAAA